MDKIPLVLKSLLENLQQDDNHQPQQQQQQARDEDERLKQLVREVIAEKSQSTAQNDLLHRVVGLMEQQVASSNREKYQQDVANVTQTFQNLMKQTEAVKKPAGAENMVVSDKQEVMKDLLDKKGQAGGDVNNKNLKLNVTKNRFPRGPFDEEDLKKPQPKESNPHGKQKVMNNGTLTKPERGISRGRGGKRGAAGSSVPPLLPAPYPDPQYPDHYPGQAAPGYHQDNRGRGNYQDNRGRGNYQDNRGRGNYQDNRGRGNYQENCGRGNYQDIGGRGNYQDNQGRGNYQENRGRGNYQDIGGRGNYQDNRGRGNYQDNRGRGNYQENRGRGNYHNQAPGHQFLGDNYQGHENYQNQVPGNYQYQGPGNFQNQGPENYPNQGQGSYPYQGPENYPYQGPGNRHNQAPEYDVNQGAMNFPSQDPQDFQDHGPNRHQIQGRGTFRHGRRGNYPSAGNDSQHHQLPETSSTREARSRPRGHAHAHALRARSYSEHRDALAANQPPLQVFHGPRSAAPYEGQGAYPKHAQNNAERKKYKAKNKTKPSQQQNVEPSDEEDSDDEEGVSKPELSPFSSVDHGTQQKNANILDNDVDSDASTASAFLPGVVVKKRNNNNRKKKKPANKASGATDQLADGAGLSGDGQSAPGPSCGPGQGGSDAPLQLFLGSGFNEEVAKTMDDQTEIADFMLIAKVKGVIKTCTPKTLGELRAFKEKHPLAEVIVVRSKDE